MKKKIKFKIEYTPLSDDRINRHKDFDGLMAAYATAPQPNVFQRWFNNRYFLFGSGLVVGLTFSALLFFQNASNISTASRDALPASEAIEHSTVSQPNRINETAADVATSPPANDLTSDQQQSIRITPPNASSAAGLEEVATRKTQRNNLPPENTDATESNYAHAETQREAPSSTQFVKQNNETVKSDDVNAVAFAKDSSVSSSDTQPKSNITAGFELGSQVQQEKNVAAAAATQQPPDTDNQTVQFDSAALHQTVSKENTPDPTPVDSTFQNVARISENTLSESGETIGDTTVIKTDTIPVVAPAQNNPTPDERVADAIKSLSDAFKSIPNPFIKSDSTKPALSLPNVALSSDSGAVAADAPVEKKSRLASLFKFNDKTTEDSFVNRFAQASFITPLGTNGADGSKYKHYVSLNVLQGHTGALEGVEFGGLANVTKGYVHGAQFGGLLNFVQGDVRGAQFGGLINTSRSLRGVQFGGVTNVNLQSATGMQTAGVINISASDSLFKGLQLAGAVNYAGGDLNGAQLSGAVNVNLRQLDGGQLSGGLNLANRISGYQVGIINVGNKMKGFQIGVINIADTIHGGSIGIINVSRNGQFSVDLWGSDALQINGGLKLGNKRVYNVYAFGVSPFANNGASTDSFILKKPSVPFGFGFGLGVHMPIKRAFVNVDMMTWTMHDRHFDFSGLNMLNQLRVTGGFRVHKLFGIYAGPVANVSVQDNKFAPFVKNDLYEYNGVNNSVRGWVGFVAGVQLF